MIASERTAPRQSESSQMALPSGYGRHHLWWLAALLAVALIAVLVGDNFKKSLGSWLPETLPDPSTYNEKQSGYSGFYELAQQMHLDVKRWQQPYRLLAGDKVHGTIVMISPWDVPTTSEAEMLARWLEEGNDLIFLDDLSLRSSRQLVGAFGFSAHNYKTKTDVTVDIDRRIPEAHLVQQLRLGIDGRVEGGNNLAADKAGGVLSEAKVGKGRVLVGTAPDMCANENLGDPACKGNFQFLINWLSSSRQPIYFDEKSHGFSSGNNVFIFILRSPVGFILLQLLILLGMAIWSLNQRFGPLVPVSSPRKISNLEFINGLAVSYQRARARNTVWAMIYQPFQGRLCKSLGVAPHEGPERLAKAWAESAGGNRNYKQYEDFLRKAQAAMEKRHLDDKELAELVARCDELAAGSRELQVHGKILGA